MSVSGFVSWVHSVPSTEWICWWRSGAVNICPGAAQRMPVAPQMMKGHVQRAVFTVYVLYTCQQQYQLKATFRLQANVAQICFFSPVCKPRWDLINTVWTAQIWSKKKKKSNPDHFHMWLQLKRSNSGDVACSHDDTLSPHHVMQVISFTSWWIWVNSNHFWTGDKCWSSSHPTCC